MDRGNDCHTIFLGGPDHSVCDGLDEETIGSIVWILQTGNLQVLTLRGYRLRYADVIRIMDALKTNTSLISLSLIGNKLGGAAGEAIAEMLKINKTLRYFSLNHSLIGNDAAAKILRTLKTNTSLQDLRMCSTGIGNTTVQVLQEVLPGLSLSCLDISGNSQKPEDIVAIPGSLWCNYSLRVLYLASDFRESLSPANSGALLRNSKAVRAAEVIQRAWRECRWDPEYQMCWKFQLGNLKRDTGLDLTEKETQPGE